MYRVREVNFSFFVVSGCHDQTTLSSTKHEIASKRAEAIQVMRSTNIGPQWRCQKNCPKASIVGDLLSRRASFILPLPRQDSPPRPVSQSSGEGESNYPTTTI